MSANAYTDIQYEAPKKAVVYARFSSAAQNEQSIEGQLTVCHEYAQRNGYQIINEYIDRAISGRSDDRPAFQQMIEDAKTRAFQYVLVYKLDRFSRNRYDSAIYKVQLKKFGVKVISCMENIGDNPESIILEAVLEASAEYYSIDLAQKIRRGQYESAKKGIFLGSRPPIGYRKTDKKLVINPDIAPHITWAFDAYASGTSKNDIIDELNRRGVRNSQGNPITTSSLKCVFSNEKYLGILDQRGVRIENAHEALTDQETFDKVQKMLAVNRHSGARNKATTPYLLTGKMYCGYCGEMMSGVSGKGRSGNIWYYYYCHGRKAKKCSKRHEKKDFIEWYVCEQTVEYVLAPERIRIIAKAVADEYKKSFNDAGIRELEKRIQRIDIKVNKIVDMLIEVPKEGRQALYDKLEACGTEKADLEKELAKLQIAHKTVLTEDMIVDWLKRFCDGNLMVMSFRKRIIDILVNSVYLFDDRIVIYYNLENGKQVSFIDMLEDVGDAPSPDEDLPDKENEGSFSEPSDGAEDSENKPVSYIYNQKRFGILVHR